MLTAFDTTCSQIVQKYNVLYDKTQKRNTEISVERYRQKLEEVTDCQIVNF